MYPTDLYATVIIDEEYRRRRLAAAERERRIAALGPAWPKPPAFARLVATVLAAAARLGLA